jgi:hypothetical protein
MDWVHVVKDSDGLSSLYARLNDMPQPFNVTVKEGAGKRRTMSQNNLFYAWMGQIGKAVGDDPSSVKADCHIQWGIPIFRAEDADYAEFIESALGGRTRQDVKRMIKAGYVPCTGLMSKPILGRYMDAVWRHYAPHVQLMNPEDLKWRNAA